MINQAVAVAPVVAPKVKPLLRGVSHALAFFAALGGLFFLAIAPQSDVYRLAGIVYGVSLCLVLGTSGFYHRPMWSDAARWRMRKLDHGAIYLLVAGTYTPFAVLAGGGHANWMLWAYWAAAIGCLLTTALWEHGNRVLRAAFYVVLGLSSTPVVLMLPRHIGVTRVLVLVAGAAFYILGASVYARRWPNPSPRVFGYHEVFHLLVLLAMALQYGVVLSVLSDL